jgi:hypothetical protein
LLFTADCTGGPDATTAVRDPTVAEGVGETVVSLTAGSTVWDRRVHQLRCRPDGITFTTVVEGAGALTDVTYFGGYDAAHPRWGMGLFLSGHTFVRGWNPEPDASGSLWFDPRSESTIDLTGGPLPGRRHWFFTPAPFCFAFAGADRWLGIGLQAEPGQYRFTEFRYHGGEGFRLTVPYDGRTRVDGRYALPSIDLYLAESAPAALEAHVARVRPPVASQQRTPAWWREPLFCGWGAQCQLAAADQEYQPADVPDVDAFVRTLRFAPAYARQSHYERWLAALARHGIHPGTVVIDDKWQLSYGENEVDPEKWPDLRRFVRDQHAAGRRVALWLKAWDLDGIPPDECICTEAGLPVAVDPTNPAYERRLRVSVRRMLSGEGYDADGFKIDFTHRIPVGPGLRAHGDAWGLELMKRLLTVIHDEAMHTKSDALVIAHAPHPYLADTVDMIRLNDMIDLTRLPPDSDSVLPALRHRAEVARIARPHAPIDTDNWPVPNRAAWREYVRAQPELGVPALYFATAIDITQEPLEEGDYALIRESWQRYRRGVSG